ncbi:hypothetical protein ES703_50347 [subsurface metagenome]
MRAERDGFTPLEIKISNGRSKKFLTGFTVVELLTVLAIIAVLMGILIPTVSFVRNTAKEAKQSVQLTAIDMALMAFKGDYGDYPESNLNEDAEDYCGAQKLAEALVGWDLLGFHPKSAWRADGYDKDGGNKTYDPDRERDDDGDNVLDTLNERVGPYLELTTANAFTLKQLFGTVTTDLALDTYVLCDSFAAKKVTIIGASKTITVNAGRPILYYRANTSSKTISIGRTDSRIYNSEDNAALVELNNPVTPDPLLSNFYDYIIDPKMTISWPYRPDSYILISAGVDGLYGTNDDICNF